MLRAALLVAATGLLSCASDVGPAYPCGEGDFAWYQGTFDGVSLSSGCVPVAAFASTGTDLGGRQGLSSLFGFWSMPQWPRRPPLCNTALSFANHALVTGERGALEAQPDWNVERVRASVFVPMSTTASACVRAGRTGALEFQMPPTVRARLGTSRRN